MNGKPNLGLIFILVMLIASACNLAPVEQQTVEHSSDTIVETRVAQTLSVIDTIESSQPEGVDQEPAPIAPDMPAEESLSTPDLHVVYVDDGALWLWTEAGGARELYSGDSVTDVILSPDAQLAAFTTVGPDYRITGLWRVSTDGTGLQKMISGPDFVGMADTDMALGSEPFLWEFIADSHTLAFNTRLTFEGPGLVIQDNIMQLNMDTGALSTAFSAGQGGYFSYSPDGTRLAFSDPESVNLINADGSNPQNDLLTFPFVNTASEFAFSPVPVWDADGSHFNVVIPSVDPFGPDASFEIFSISRDGSSVSNLGEYNGNVAHLNAAKMVSPDGRAVVYLSHSGSGQELHLAEIGGEDNFYADEINDIKGWSQDSQYFVFGTTDGKIWLGQVGTEPMLVDGATSAADVIWLEDGRFVFSSGTFEEFSLRIGTPGSGSILIATPAATLLIFDAVP